jgi:hypothetical protein
VWRAGLFQHQIVTFDFDAKHLTSTSIPPTPTCAKIHKSGAVYEEAWNRLNEVKKKIDPEKRSYAVLERAEDLLVSC